MFKLVDRNYKDTLVLVPGWAFDYRIFSTLDLPYNYIFYCDSSFVGFETKLGKTLSENNITKISLLGWSKGIFPVCGFAAKNPNLVEVVYLIAPRKRYENPNLENAKSYLSKNKTAWLYRFYKNCFCAAEKAQYQWFKKTLLKDYLEDMSSSKLITGLSYLSSVELLPETLGKINRLILIHGKDDKIAPLEDTLELANQLPQAKLITLEKTGHLPFLHDDFKKRLYEH